MSSARDVPSQPRWCRSRGPAGRRAAAEVVQVRPGEPRTAQRSPPGCPGAGVLAGEMQGCGLEVAPGLLEAARRPERPLRALASALVRSLFLFLLRSLLPKIREGAVRLGCLEEG